jgi:hypothetical protein
MTVSIDDAKNGAPGETPARDGDLAPPGGSVATHAAAIEAFKRKHGVARLVGFVADDFDAPLPEDFLMISRE